MTQKMPDYLEQEDIDELLETAKAYNFRDYLLLNFMWRTGARVSEAISVTPNDIELRRNVVNIRHAKGGKQRRALLDEKTIKQLLRYIKKEGIGKNEPIFGIHRTQVFNIIKKYGAMIGVNIHPHTLRHSFAIFAIRSGVDIRRLSMMLGHSSIAITQVYLQFNDDDLREAYEKMSFA